MSGRRRLRNLRLALVATVAAGLVVLIPAAAHAELCEVTVDNQIKLVDCDTGSGNDGDDGDDDGGGGSNGVPACEIEPGDNACYEGESCLINDPAKADLELIADDLGPKPGDDYHPAFRACGTGDYLWYWSDDGGPSLEELALEAYGNLPFPTFTAAFNPPGRTLVNLETWWWADDASTAPLTASAGSVTVTAEPNRMQVDPGDGSAPVVCNFITSKSDECVHVYRKARSGGYTARIRLVWNVSFTDDDSPITLEGLPTTFTSPWQATNVPVREVQTVVVPD